MLQALCQSANEKLGTSGLLLDGGFNFANMPGFVGFVAEVAFAHGVRMWEPDDQVMSSDANPKYVYTKCEFGPNSTTFSVGDEVPLDEPCQRSTVYAFTIGIETQALIDKKFSVYLVLPLVTLFKSIRAAANALEDSREMEDVRARLEWSCDPNQGTHHLTVRYAHFTPGNAVNE